MERVTDGVRGLIDRLDRSLDGECEAPTVNEWCEAADQADRRAGDEVAYALAQQENDMGDWVVPVRCRECRHRTEADWGGVPALVCALRPMGMHRTEPEAFCSWGRADG